MADCDGREKTEIAIRSTELELCKKEATVLEGELITVQKQCAMLEERLHDMEAILEAKLHEVQVKIVEVASPWSNTWPSGRRNCRRKVREWDRRWRRGGQQGMVVCRASGSKDRALRQTWGSGRESQRPSGVQQPEGTQENRSPRRNRHAEELGPQS